MSADVIDLWRHPLGKAVWEKHREACRVVRPTFGMRKRFTPRDSRIRFSPEVREARIRQIGSRPVASWAHAMIYGMGPEGFRRYAESLIADTAAIQRRSDELLERARALRDRVHREADRHLTITESECEHGKTIHESELA